MHIFFQLNRYTAYFDLHQIYGISVAQNKDLRALIGGLLKVEKKNDQDWFQISQNPTRECTGFTNLFGATGQCFKGGKFSYYQY